MPPNKEPDMSVTPTLLLILDGWGIAPAGPGNAASLAKTPNMDALLASCPHSELTASGRAVGLPEGYMGNSEVGHLNIGAGRIVYQDMTRIDVAIENGSFATNPVICDLLARTKKSGGTLHLAGLLSDGGVHSHINHLFALCRLARKAGVPVCVHCLLDGRDTPPDSGLSYVRALEAELARYPDQEIAALYGRFYAMDRDKRWERVSQAFNLFVHGEGPVHPGAESALQASYDEKVYDEFVKPVWVSRRTPGLKDGDGVFFFNFRADRMREIVSALTLPKFVMILIIGYVIGEENLTPAIQVVTSIGVAVLVVAVMMLFLWLNNKMFDKAERLAAVAAADDYTRAMEMWDSDKNQWKDSYLGVE